MGDLRPYDALLCDFDGVLRVWNVDVARDVERSYGLPPGTMAAVAFASDRLMPALRGQVTDAEWCSEIVAALAQVYEAEVGAAAVRSPRDRSSDSR